MVRVCGQSGEQSIDDNNENLATILANIQQRLEEQAIKMQQQSTVIQNLEHRAKWMLEMFRPNITLEIESGGGQPTTMVDYIEKTYMIEYCLN